MKPRCPSEELPCRPPVVAPHRRRKSHSPEPRGRLVPASREVWRLTQVVWMLRAVKRALFRLAHFLLVQNADPVDREELHHSILLFLLDVLGWNLRKPTQPDKRHGCGK